jgi:hypothetical protein
MLCMLASAVALSPTAASANTHTAYAASLRSSSNASLAHVPDFACVGCLKDVQIRALFLENVNAVVNTAASDAAERANKGYPCGSCCADPGTMCCPRI